MEYTLEAFCSVVRTLLYLLLTCAGGHVQKKKAQKQSSHLQLYTLAREKEPLKNRISLRIWLLSCMTFTAPLRVNIFKNDDTLLMCKR